VGLFAAEELEAALDAGEAEGMPAVGEQDGHALLLVVELATHGALDLLKVHYQCNYFRDYIL
jgi:hypothetical protein